MAARKSRMHPHVTQGMLSPPEFCWGEHVARLRWLHLSDLHLGMGAHGSRLRDPYHREAFEQDLRRVHAQSGPWDVVFISGDLSLTGSIREFHLVDATLSSLWDYFRLLGSDPCLLAVPGNHDVWRGSSKAEEDLGARYRALDVRKAFREPSMSRLKQAIWEGFAPYNDWFHHWRTTHPSAVLKDVRQGLLPGDFIATVATSELRVGVLGLNSNFRSSAREEEAGVCEIDVEQIRDAVGGNLQEWGSKHDLLMLLTHHPPSKLRSKSLSELGEHLAPTGSLLLHLCGNRHAEGDWLMRYQPSPWSLAIHAPSLFSALEGEEGQWGYIAGEIDPSSVGQLKVFPRGVSSQRGVLKLGPWSSALPGSQETIEYPVDDLLNKQVLKLAWVPSSSESLVEDWRLAPETAPEAAPRFWVEEPEKPSTPLPPGVKLRTLLRTGNEQVGSVAWSPSGKELAVGLSGGQLACWTPGDAQPRWVVQAHKTGILDLCFDPNGQSLASRSEKEVRIWRRDGTQVPLPKPIRSKGIVTAWSSHGLLAVAADNRGIQLWDTETWTEVGQVSASMTPAMKYSLLWPPNEDLLCSGEGRTSFSTVRVEREDAGIRILIPAHRDGPDKKAAILEIARMPGSSRLALARRDRTIQIWDLDEDESVDVLEGHTDAVTSVSFSFDGRLLASKSLDGTIALWRTDTWEEVARLDEPLPTLSYAGLAFSPTQNTLASQSADGQGVRLWELDVELLLRAQAPSTTVHEVSAKVVLVGEGRVGKSCLAARMVKGEYKELDPTHGMQFWPLPIEAPTLGARREIILWDLGGQSEYQLVHQLFLRDSTVALMVMEPARGESALEEIEGWDMRLKAQIRDRSIRKLLVGTKVDNPESPVNRTALEELVQRLGCEPYMLTSAKHGHGIPELKATLGRLIDWGSIEKVSRPELFQRMRQLIQRLREARRVVISLSELEGELRREMGSAFDPEALRTVVAHLARQGLVADTRMAGGMRVLILEVEQIERYAGSLIIAARENPHGVPAIEVAKVLSSRMQFPRIKPEERLREDQELPVLNCVIEMLIEHGLCLLHEGLLIFPSLFQPKSSESGAEFSHPISMHYDFFGPIDNIYASLITSLAISQRFGPMRLWMDRAEFGQVGKDVSGVRRVRSQSQGARGIAQLDVYFDDETDARTRELFVNFVERHLNDHGVKLIERLIITCVCGQVVPPEIAQLRLADGRTDVACQVCERRLPLTAGAQQARERNPALVQEVQAIRTAINEQRKEAITEVKGSAMDGTLQKKQREMPIRILHLSDLHISAEDDPISLLHPLGADLRNKDDGLGVERLDYLVISGDLTNRASDKEFKKAYEFVSGLIKEFGLSPQRCIIVPGNHDLDWGTPVYAWKSKREVDASKLKEGTFQDAGPGYLVRDDAKYPDRFKNFNDHFYHPLIQRPYPLPPEEQCIPSFFSGDRLQFLAMNSAWEIDEYFQNRSSISVKGLARGLDAADKELAEARAKGDLGKDESVLRLTVWHHPITGNEKIQADAFMGQLRRANVRFCLHGHVHEERTELLNYLEPKKAIYVVGGGSFGAPTYDRPESVPRLYNLLEVRRDLQQVTVHTRSRHKDGGSWEGWAMWPDPEGKPGRKSSSYVITLT